jgi:nitronate monooxygenase
MAGGVSTPQLVAAASEAGALGFLPAGYLTAERLAADIEAVRSLSSARFGVNIFKLSESSSDPARLAAYAAELQGEAERYGVAVGEPRGDDDQYEAKLALIRAERIEAVSFTFGCPSAETVSELEQAGAEVWVTVTDPLEAAQAEAAGADVLIAQGIEAGGHRGCFGDGPDQADYGLLALIRLIKAQTALPVVGAGGVMDGPGIAAVLCAGAVAAQLGSAFVLADEAGTAPAVRELFASDAQTRFTRAFTGRQARGVVNRFMTEHEAQAFSAYPQLHHMTSPIRAAARAQGDAQAVNVWAGQAHRLARELPAAEIVTALLAETRAALAAAQRATSSAEGV